MSVTESQTARDGQSAEPRRPWLTPLVGVGLWLASVAVMTGLFSAVMWSLRASGTPSQAALDGWLWGSRDQKLAALREAYSGRRPVITDPRREEIEKFLTEVTKTSDSVGEGAWIGVLDETRFRRRVMGSPWGRSLSWFDRRQLAAMSAGDFSIVSPNQMTSIKLLHIAPWADGDETLVFTLAKQGYQEVEPVLFWLSQSDGRWKLVDWEWVDTGWSESQSAAHWAAMSGDPLGSSYESAMWKLREADGLDYSKRDEYERLLRQVEGYPVPSAAADYTRYLLMNRWHHHYRPEEVRRLAGLVLEPDRVPGVHVLRAIACQRLGKNDEALAALDRVEQLVGFRPSLTASRAHMLERDRKREDALAQWRRLADFDPGERSYLSQMLRLLPKSKRSEILERIKAHDEPLKLAAEVAQFNRYQLEEPFLDELSRFAKSLAAESDEARQIEIVRLECKDQYAEAAALSRQAAEQETDKPKQNEHWQTYLSQMHQAGELLTGFAAHPDPKAAFQALVSGMDEDEAMIAVEDLPPLLAAYREKQPDDPWLGYYEGYYAASRYRFADADKSFAAAERLLPEPKPGFGGRDEDEEDETDGLRYLLRNQRCRARYELGQAVEALEEYKRHEAAYQTLAQLALQYRQWKLLNRLNQSFAIQQPRNLWITYYEAKSLLAAKNFDAVRGKLAILQSRQNETPGMEYYREELELDLLKAEVADPVTVYLRSKDHVSAFNRLSHQLLAERDWDNLEKLCQRHRVGPNSPEVVMIRLEQAWRQHDHEGLIKLLTPWPTEAFAQRMYYETSWRERQVRSLLRLNRWDEAHQHAQEAYRRHEEPWPLVMTYVARNNAEEIGKLLREDESFAESWTHRDFANDRDLRPVLLNDAFVELRQQQVFRLPTYHDGESLALLYSQPVELSEAWLRERLAEPGTPLEVRLESKSTATVTWRGRRFHVLASPMPYFPAEFVDRLVPQSRRPLPDTDRYSVYLRQRAHLTIIPLRSDDDEPWNSPTVSVREIGSRLLNADVVGAVYYSSSDLLRYLVPLTERAAETLASRRPLDEVEPQGIVLREPLAHHSPIEERQALRKLIEAGRSEANPPEVLVDVLMVDDQLRMLQRFRVSELRRERFGDYELIVEVPDPRPNPRFPELRPGIKFTVPIEQVFKFSTRPPR